MGVIDRYEDLKMKSIRIKTEVNQHLTSAQDLKHQYEEVSKSLLEEKESALIQESSINVLKEIVDKLSQEHIERIVDLLSYSLQTIYFDKNYTVEVVMGDKRNNKTAEFFLIEKTDTEVIRSSFNDSIGGGILAVVGFILQVYYLGVLNQANIMFCDESFSQVSSQYIDTLVQFINELADTKEFIFVLISHDSRLIPYARKTYKVTSGVVSEVKK